MYIKFKNKNPTTQNYYIWLFNNDNRLITVCRDFFELENRIKQELEKKERRKENCEKERRKFIWN